jgi:hypothetical protein
MKIFISIPMNGRPDEEVLSEMKTIIQDYEDIYGGETELIETLLPMDNTPVNNERIYMLGRSIQLMALADAVIFAPNWKKARGCRVEELVAKSYGIRRYYYLRKGKMIDSEHGLFVYGCPENYETDDF